jgi:signal transduction histidine kinase
MSAPGLHPRLMRFEARWLDPALALVFFITLEIEILTAPYRDGPVILNALLVALMTLPLAWRRRAPLAAVLVVLSATLIEALALTNVTRATTSIFVLLVVPYGVAAWSDRRRAVVGLAACLATGLTVSVTQVGTAGDVISTVTAMSVSWATGRAMRARRLLTRELADKAARADAEREDRARLAVADERTRIARELQAVVAQRVTAMVVGAEAALRSLDDDPACADQQIAEIEGTGRQALDEMRRILGVLRAEETAEREPQPGMGQLPALVERARAAGLRIELRVEGEPAPLPAAVDLTAYRIMQEALTGSIENADRYAAVIVRYGQTALELELVDDGSAEGRFDATGEARLRERAASLGGDIRWGPHNGGGFAIHAALPGVFDEAAAS